MRPAVDVVEPVRRVEQRRMILPNVEKQLPVLARYIKINVAVLARKDSCRRHRAMLAAGSLENLLLVGPQPHDMLMGTQGLLHRRIDVIALSRALAPIE